MKIKTIGTNGISYIEPVPGATSEWYYGVDYKYWEETIVRDLNGNPEICGE